MIINYCRRVWHFWWWVIVRFYADGCMTRASALTFTSLLALVPFAAVVFAVFSVLPVFAEFSTQLQDFIFANFVPSTGKMVQDYLIGFTQQANKLPVVSLVFLVGTALLMMVSIESTLNDMWKVRYSRQLSGSLLLYWAMLTLGPLLLGLSLLLSSYLGSLHIWQGLDAQLLQKNHLLWLLPMLCEFLAFSLLYLVVPHCSVRLHHAVLGALVATLLFEVSKYGFGYYVAYFPTYRLLYGALAVIPLFLVWLYCAWLIFLFGAEIVNGLRLHQAKRSVRYMPLFVLAYRLLGHLAQAQRQQRVLSLLDLLALESHCSVTAMIEVLTKLQALGYIYETTLECYVLNVDLHLLTLHQLYQQLEWFLPETLTVGQQDHWHQQLISYLQQFGQQNQHLLAVSLYDLYFVKEKG